MGTGKVSGMILFQRGCSSGYTVTSIVVSRFPVSCLTYDIFYDHLSVATLHSSFVRSRVRDFSSGSPDVGFPRVS